MELIDDDGILQSIYLPAGVNFPPRGRGRYLDGDKRHAWTISKWMDYYGWDRPTTPKKAAEYFSAHNTGRVDTGAVFLTDLEIFPRKNQWGDIHP